MTHILVVDDDETILDLLREALPALGYTADFAIAGDKAIQMIKKNRYDLILSDIRMPEINGIDVARAAYEDRPEIHILFMSVNPNTIVEDRSFLAKPFTIGELETKLEYVLTPQEE